MADGKVPLDLAFARWIAIERGVVVLPNVIFYSKDSLYKNDSYVRIAICKTMEHSISAIQKLKNKKK
jgi:aspartate/methionine/tyrosine aminotransferase